MESGAFRKGLKGSIVDDRRLLVLASHKVNRADPLVCIKIQGIKAKAVLKCTKSLIFLVQGKQRISLSIVVFSSRTFLSSQPLTGCSCGFWISKPLGLFIAVQAL